GGGRTAAAARSGARSGQAHDRALPAGARPHVLGPPRIARAAPARERRSRSDPLVVPRPPRGLSALAGRRSQQRRGGAGRQRHAALRSAADPGPPARPARGGPAVAGLRVMGERLVRWRAEERRQLWIAFGVTLAAALLLDTFVLPRAAAAWTALAPAPAETASSHDDAGQALRPPSNPEHTAAPSQPPARIGPDYDDDRHLARRARPVASYDLAARLDAERHTVTGKGTIRWTNASSEPATELYWHLYLNAFKNERTLFLRSPFGAGRTAQRAADWGYTKIERLVAAGADLLPRLAQHSPGDPDDQTSLRLELPAPV